MTISVLGTILVFAGLFYVMGATVASQTSELTDSFPELLEKGEDFLENTETGKEIVVQFDKLKKSDGLKEFASGFFQSTFGGIGDLYIILLIGIYFTANPSIYKNGLLYLIPPKNRTKAEEVIQMISSDLTKWLFGKFVAMSIVFVFTAIALAIVGLPMWLALAFISGMLVFIPNFGPIISAVPTLLVALSEGGNMVWIVGLLYLVIQLTEGSVITPKLQNKLVKVPPAAIILGQIFAGTLIGVWGLVFATPIVLILKILIEELYIQPMQDRYEAHLVTPDKTKKIPSASKEE